MKRSMKKGFTLAEVLITLVVIGIVVALTIPALLQNTRQAELKTALKKSIAVLNQAIVMSIAQDSIDASSCTNCSSNAQKLAEFFIGKLNVLSQNVTSPNAYFYTADGMRFDIIQSNGTCGTNSTTDPAPANCVVLVDVNGDKLPNDYSTGNTTANVYTFRDRYRLIVTANSVLPAQNATSDVTMKALQQ